jgi:hypothetical protein
MLNITGYSSTPGGYGGWYLHIIEELGDYWYCHQETTIRVTHAFLVDL